MSDPRPEFGPYTEALYSRLPALYRDADEAQDEGTSNYPLLRYLSLVGDQLTRVADLLGRFTYDALDERDNTDEPWDRYGTGLFGTGVYGDADFADLVDPYTSDAAWLPWLAQLLGIDVTGLTIDEQRAALANPADAWAHGTREAIIRLVRPRLPEGAYVDVVPHHLGDPFTIAVVTRAAETVGVTTFAELKAAAPTWADLKALGSWGNSETAGLLRAAEAERPAGYRLAHAYLETIDTAPPPAPEAINLLGAVGSFEDDAALAAWGPNTFYGAYPVNASRAIITGDATDGEKCLEIMWNAPTGFIVAFVGGLTPGLTYRVTADVKVPDGSSDVGLVLLLKAPTTWARTRDQWQTVTSPAYVADSTILWIGFVAAGFEEGARAGHTARVDNVRLTVV